MPLQRGEHAVERVVVGLLGAGEAGAVDAVVELGVDPLAERVDLVAQRLGVEVEIRVAGEVVERRAEHADDLGRLVVDDRAGLLVPQHRDADAVVVVRVGGAVGLGEEVEAVDVVDVAPARERPAALVAVRMQVGDPDRVLEALQHAHDHRPVRPRAGQRDVEVVAPGLGPEPVLADPAAEYRVGPEVLAFDAHHRGLSTQSPATMVASTSDAGSISGSRSSTTRSASKPARRRPRRSSSKLSHAGATVKDSSAAPGGTSSSAAARRPASGSSSSTGASEPAAIRAPGREQRAERIRVVDPVGPDPLHELAIAHRMRVLHRRGDAERREARRRPPARRTARARCDGARRASSPPRTRRARRGWLGRRSRARRARSRPARRRGSCSASASELVISTPEPSSSRAVREPSVPSMNALT